MSLVIYNTLSKKREAFKPLNDPHVKMYVCGPTVYDSCHVGHARSAVVFDMVRRYLEFKGYQVKYVRNFTDIDDKIIQRSLKENIPCRELAEKYIQEYIRDMHFLDVLNPSEAPKATEYISDIVSFIEALIEKNLAYTKPSGVYFRVNNFSKYGSLSKRSLEEMLASSRVELEEDKEHPGDFALWKASKENEPAWPSPWGEGRPGWHIECSTMSSKTLGDEIDIHGGGADLLFPHHENELAQSEGKTEKTFAKYWMHHEMVNFKHEKMSKSLKNFIMISDLKKSYSPSILRFFLLSKHYRSPIEYSKETLADSEAAITRLENLFSRLAHLLDDTFKVDIPANFITAMDNDFSTPEAIAEIMNHTREANKSFDQGNESKAKTHINLANKMLQILGININLKKEQQVICSTDTSTTLENLLKKELLLDNDIEQILNFRNLFRQEKNWEAADQIRDFLKHHGIIIKDSKTGISWIRE